MAVLTTYEYLCNIMYNIKHIYNIILLEIIRINL